MQRRTFLQWLAVVPFIGRWFPQAAVPELPYNVLDFPAEPWPHRLVVDPKDARDAKNAEMLELMLNSHPEILAMFEKKRDAMERSMRELLMRGEYKED